MSSRNAGIDLEQPAAARHEVVRHVDRETADADVGHRQPRAAAGLEQVVDLLAGLVEVPEVRERADVHEVRADADAVVHDPGELGEDRAHELAAVRDLDAEHLLDGPAVADAVDHRRAVVEPVGVGDDLVPVVRLGHLLEAAVEVADDRLGPDDLLAVEARDEVDGPVRRRVRGADLDRLRLEVPGHLFGVSRPLGHPQVLLGKNQRWPGRSPCAAGGRRRRRGRGCGAGSDDPGSRSRRGRRPRARTSRPPARRSRRSGARASRGRTVRQHDADARRARCARASGGGRPPRSGWPTRSRRLRLSTPQRSRKRSYWQPGSSRRKRARASQSPGPTSIVGMSRSTTRARPATGDDSMRSRQLLRRGRERGRLDDAGAQEGCSAAKRRRARVAGLLAGLDLLLELEDRVDQLLGRRRAARDVDVHGDDLVDPLRHVVRPVEASRGGADAHRDDPLGLGHLVVDPPQDRRHLVRHRAGDDQQVRLARREADDLRAEAGDVVVRRRDRHELDAAAGGGERERPERVAAGPGHHLLELRGEELALAGRPGRGCAGDALLREEGHRARFYA